MKINMKNIIRKSVGGVALLTTMIPALALASADVSLNSSSIQVKTGNTFTISVDLKPIVETAYTSKIAISYPSDMLTVTSFSYSPTWLALSQPGYDLIDNTNGQLIKTAGYPGGLSTAKTFGTITFMAKKNGTATITVGKETQIFDSTNKNIFSGVQNSVQVSVTAPATIPSVQTQTTSIIPVENTSPVQSQTVVTETSQDTNTVNTSSQIAAVGATSGISRTTLYTIIVLIILLGGGIYAWKKMPKRKTV